MLNFFRGLRPYSRLNSSAPEEHETESESLLPMVEIEKLHDPGERNQKTNMSRTPQTSRWRRFWKQKTLLVSLLGILACIVVILLLVLKPARPASSTPSEAQTQEHSEIPSQDSPKVPTTDNSTIPSLYHPHTASMDPETYAQWSLDTLFERQSTSLAEATARYTLKTGRPPPRNYDLWFDFARERSCLIDDYDQVERDFEPFYQLAQRDPTFFKRMVDAGINRAKTVGIKMMKSAVVRKGKFLETDRVYAAYDGDWQQTFSVFAKILPDMDLLLNGHDEPRVLFNPREFGSVEKALSMPNDSTPFFHNPSHTADVYTGGKKCLVPLSNKGFAVSANDASAFLIDSTASDYTEDLYPVMSMTKISPCFSDILVPSEYYYNKAWWSPKYSHPNDIAWENKKPMLYWRGHGTGGQIHRDNYHKFPRFRAVTIGRNHTDIMSIIMTGIVNEHCGWSCDRPKIEKEYGVTALDTPREEQYQYKYLLDLDGNSFSARYLGLLRSGSLVFKSTVFTEFFHDWLIPFVHFIPVLPDLSDMAEKVEWAIANDAAARRIQETGRLLAEKLLTDNQNDCYWGAVLLEWGQLWQESREKEESVQ
ncbi:glycosyl transferase family 90-domain-containing protein [Mycena floridula]|nr:glycosyl transferase family 90-domain-containing protein [Mycena floridula]